MFTSALNSLLQAHQIDTFNGDQTCRQLHSCRKLATHRAQLIPFYPQRKRHHQVACEDQSTGGTERLCDVTYSSIRTGWWIISLWSGEICWLQPRAGKNLHHCVPFTDPEKCWHQVTCVEPWGRAELITFIKRWAVLHMEFRDRAGKPLHFGFASEIPQMPQSSLHDLCVFEISASR